MHRSIDLIDKALIERGSLTVDTVSAYNVNEVDCWLYFYDARRTSNVTLGTTEHIARMLVPGGSSGLRGANGSDFNGLGTLYGLVVGVLDVDGFPPTLPLEIEVSW